MIQNSANVVAVSPEINNRLNALYSSIRIDITGSANMTVRQWLTSQSFEKQYLFGLKAIEMVSKGLW